MARDGGRWLPDGRASRLRADCEASLVALDGLPIDLYLVHAPDPRTPWRTTLRALARLADEGLVRRVGVSNVTRGQLDEALELAPVAAVEVALSPFDDRALRGGVVDRCVERGLAVIAHAPLGGPARAPRLARIEALRTRRGRARREPGRGRPRLGARARSGRRRDPRRADAGDGPLGRACVTARSRRAGARGARVGVRRAPPGRPAPDGRGRGDGGRPRDGHPRRRQEPRRGAARRGGLRPAEPRRARRLAPRPRRGARRRARARAGTRRPRQHVPRPCGPEPRRRDGRAARRRRALRVARHAARRRAGQPRRAPPRPLRRAPGPGRAARRLARGAGAPRARPRRCGRSASSSRRATTRASPTWSASRSSGGRPPAATPRASSSPRGAIGADGWEAAVADAAPDAPHLVFDWRPDGHVDELAEVVGRLERLVTGPVDAAVCPHGGGPPVCWCRPPLPGLPLAFARAHGVDPARSTVLGTSPAHRTLAAALGAAVVLLPRPG